MRALIRILDELKHNIKHEEKLWVAEHALDLAPSINKYFFQLVEAGEKIEAAKEHLKTEHRIREKKSLTELLHIALSPYENRTIHIEEEQPDYAKLVGTLRSYRNMDFVANYGHYLFEPLDINMWKEHEVDEGSRMVLYARDLKNKGKLKHKREIKAIKEISDQLGDLVADKRKKYGKYAFHTYSINHKHGIHGRPSALIVGLANKYPGGDIWIRTDSREANAKSILSLFRLVATSDKKLTVLYKPAKDSRDFYEKLESLEMDKKNLLIKIR